uniref:Uncharacterized protein n=1 Tax=Anguilla anguilla TaxID=7936 RepID=A0A0E9SSX6_ANGAN
MLTPMVKKKKSLCSGSCKSCVFLAIHTRPSIFFPYLPHEICRSKTSLHCPQHIM